MCYLDHFLKNRYQVFFRWDKSGLIRLSVVINDATCFGQFKTDCKEITLIMVVCSGTFQVKIKCIY